MEYSNRFSVRLGQIEKSDDILADGTKWGMSELNELAEEFITHKNLTTINWLVEPTKEIGMPTEPYKVEWNTVPWPTSAQMSNIKRLDKASPLAILLEEEHIAPWGALAVSFNVVAVEKGIEVYALDSKLSEILGTRQVAVVGNPCVFVGPNVFYIQSTGEIELEEFVYCSPVSNQLNEHEVNWKLLAKVGPSFVSSGIPTGGHYENQAYLNLENLSSVTSLFIRQKVDALARGNVAKPKHTDILDIHEQNVEQTSNAFNSSEPINVLANKIGRIISEPDFTFTKKGDRYKDDISTYKLPIVPIIQMMSRSGPIESLTLGQAVTIPFDEEMFPILDKAKFHSIMFKGGVKNFENSIEYGVLPFPLVRVRGKYNRVPEAENENTESIEEYGFAGVDLLTKGGFFVEAKSYNQTIPKEIDEHAHADVDIYMKSEASAWTHYVSRITNGRESFIKNDLGLMFAEKADETLRIMLPSFEESVEGEMGHPRLNLIQEKSPFELDELKKYKLYPRDIFGRWIESDEATCKLTAWPVGRPTIDSGVIEFKADGKVYLNAIVRWDRTIRKLKGLNIAMHILPKEEFGKPKNKLAEMPSLLSNKLVEKPKGKFEPEFLASVLFKDNGEPTKKLYVQNADLRQSNVHVYYISIELGKDSDIYSMDEPYVKVMVDAIEVVSGKRRTVAPLNSIYKSIDDPRAPVFEGEPWELKWTSMPGGVSTVSTLLSLPKISTDNGPSGKHFHIWRASESAVMNFALANSFSSTSESGDLYSVIKQENNAEARLALIQAFLEPLLKNSIIELEFSKLFRADTIQEISALDKHVEINLPKEQTGFEFLMVTAVSKSGISSDKRASNYLKVVAVPIVVPQTRPLLRVITSSDNGLLERTGMCLAIVGSDSIINRDQVRIYWDSGIKDMNADQMLDRQKIVAELSISSAHRYVANIKELIDEGLPSEFNSVYLIKPKETWQKHHFSVDLKKLNTAKSTRLDEIPSPRSLVERKYIAPAANLTFNNINTVIDERFREVEVSNWILENKPNEWQDATLTFLIIDYRGDTISVPTKIVTGGFNWDFESILNCSYDVDSKLMVVKVPDGCKTLTIIVTDYAGREFTKNIK